MTELSHVLADHPGQDIISRADAAPTERCPVCGSERLMPLRCKVICQGCRTIVQSCADL